jgi:hypothetical protein
MSEIMDQFLKYPNCSRQARRVASLVMGALSFVAVLGLASSAAAAVKKVPYPEIKVDIDEAYRPEAAFEAMIARLSAAVAKKDEQALFAHVGPNFVWTVDGTMAEDFDLGRDVLHNFKVVFGFRDLGKDADGGVQNGPFWSALAAFLEDKTYYKATDSGNLICGPIRASFVNESTFDQASKKIAGADDQLDWYFTVGDTAVAKAPGDRGPPVGKVGRVALPVLSTSPAAKPGEAAQPVPDFLEILMPSGKTGWIPASSAKPLSAEHLCYAKTASGEWKIVAYDQPQ